MPGQPSFVKRLLLGVLSLAVAAAIWVPLLGLLFRQDARPYFAGGVIPRKARLVAAYHLRLWADPELREREIEKMRGHNAEWDFMGRTFLVLALANMALTDPGLKDDHLEVIDRIIEETLRLEGEKSHYHFLMPYARKGSFVQQPASSLFVDGEIALMLAARRIVEEKQEYEPLLAERVRRIVERMKKSDILCAESYPDECWMFCNTAALAAIRMADVLDGTDHSAFFRQWVETAKKRLIHPETGLLFSSFTLRGKPIDGPEGTSIWMAAHCLQLIDEEFAAVQYARAKKELARNVLGMAYAREWPKSWRGPRDIDSGPVVPVLEASAAASGLAFLAARSFGDRDYYAKLMASLELGGLPIERDGTLRYAASNAVGDAVILYSMVLGPLWGKAKAGGER